MDKIGPTGDYPRGKLNPDDEGGLAIGVTQDHQGNLRIDFGKPVAWIAMPRDQAMAFALMIMKNCRLRPANSNGDDNAA